MVKPLVPEQEPIPPLQPPATILLKNYVTETVNTRENSPKMTPRRNHPLPEKQSVTLPEIPKRSKIPSLKKGTVIVFQRLQNQVLLKDSPTEEKEEDGSICGWNDKPEPYQLNEIFVGGSLIGNNNSNIA